MIASIFRTRKYALIDSKKKTVTCDSRIIEIAFKIHITFAHQEKQNIKELSYIYKIVVHFRD